jgi:outer membrane protein TolC
MSYAPCVRADDGGAAPNAFAPPSAAGPAVRRLTLDEAKQLTMLNNKALNLARLNVAEKGHAIAAAKKDYLPKLLGTDTYFRFNDNLGSVVTVEKGKLGLLAPGISTINAAVLNQNTNLASVMVAQPITKLIAVNAAVQLARADEGTAQAQLDKAVNELMSGVAQAYYGLLGLQRIQTVLEMQINLLEQALQASPSPELRIGLVQTRQGLLQVRGQVRELTQQLNDLLDLPPQTALELIDPVPGDVAVRNPEEAAELALTCSPEVREAQQGIAKAEAAMKMARMAYLPDVNVIGGYANQTFASYIQPNIGFVGVTGNVTLFEWGKKRDVTRQREMDMALANQNVLVAKDKVRLEARKAFGGYEQAREDYRLAGEMVQARKDAEKAATGAAAAQAKTSTAKAELDYMKAEIAYRVAHAQLTGLIGGK